MNGTTPTGNTGQPEELDEFIELIKNGEYGYSVSLGAENEDPLAGVNLKGETPLPVESVHKEFEGLFDDIAIKLTEIVANNSGVERAHKFGEMVVEKTSTHPYLTEENVCDIIDLEGVSQSDVRVFVDFYTVYPNGNYPEKVHVETVSVLKRLYDGEKARRIIEKLHENGLYSNDGIIEAYKSVDEIAVERVVEELIEAEVNDVEQGVIITYVIEQNPIPDDIENVVDELTTKSNSTNDMENDETKTESNTEENRKHTSIAEKTISSLQNSNETFDSPEDAFEHVLNEINHSGEFEGLDKYWQLGDTMMRFKHKYGFTYNKMFSDFDVNISKTYGVRARKLAELFEYEQYPDNVTVNTVYEIDRETNDSTQTRKVINRVEGCSVNITKVHVDVWKALDEPTPSEIINYMQEEGNRINEDTVTAVGALYNDSIVTTAEMVDALNVRSETDNQGEDAGEINGFTKTITESDTEKAVSADKMNNDVKEDLSNTPTDAEANAVDEYITAIQQHESVSIDNGIVKSHDSDVATVLGKAYSHSLPSKTVVSALRAFDKITHVTSGNSYWSGVMETHTSVAVSTLSFAAQVSEATGSNEQQFANKYEQGTPYSIIEKTNSCSDPVFFSWPDDDNDKATLALTTYAANGGDVVVYLGEWWGGSGSESFITQLTKHYDCAMRLTPLQWEGNSDALYVYTRSGELPKSLAEIAESMQNQQPGFVEERDQC